MTVLRGDPATWEVPEAGTVVAVGVFDGVHRGHRRVLAALGEAPDDGWRVALTFDRNPLAVVDPRRAPTALVTLERRIELLLEEVDAVAVIRFDDDLRRLQPAAFVEHHLVAGLRSRRVVVGEGFRFGYRAAGTIDTLRELGAVHGFEVVAVPILELEGLPVRSTIIRDAVRRGDVELAGRFLGRPPEVEGEVVPGDGRGRAIGFPTANLALTDDATVPAWGVYAVQVVLLDDGTVHPGVANVGVRPTFDGTAEVVEVHLLDGPCELYGRRLRVGFVARLRSERRFATVDQLVAQIRRDTRAAAEALSRTS